MSYLDAAFQPNPDPEQIADRYAADAAERTARRHNAADEHCYHHQHDDRCGGFDDDCDDNANDRCVGCDCCCNDPAIQYAKGDR